MPRSTGPDPAADTARRATSRRQTPGRGSFGRPADLRRHARVDLGRLDESLDLEVLAELDVHQARGGAVVDGRNAVARQGRRIAEPARHVAARRLAPDLGVRSVDCGDELVALLDLRA